MDWQSKTGQPGYINNIPIDPLLYETFSPAERVTAIPKTNCKDYWLVTAVQRNVKVMSNPNSPKDHYKIYSLPYQPAPTYPGLSAPYTQSQNSISCNMQHGPMVIRVFDLTNQQLTHHQDFDIRDPHTNEEFHLFEVGHLKVSPDGTKLALVNGHSGLIRHGQEIDPILSTDPNVIGTNNGEVFLFDFDKTTGIVNLNHRYEIIDDPVLYGLEFSPNSELLYAMNFPVKKEREWDGRIYQLPVSASAAPFPTQITTPTLTIDQYHLFPPAQTIAKNPIGALQLGPDGNIYIAMNKRSYLHRITNVNGVGAFDAVSNPTGCRYDQQDRVVLANGQSQLGLPNLLVDCPCPCECDDDCDCSCPTCNEKAKEQNEEMNARANEKNHKGAAGHDCLFPFPEECERSLMNNDEEPAPCFYLHWGDNQDDTISIPETQLLYIKVCNPYNDVQFNGLKITKLTLFHSANPTIPVDIDRIQLVPDRFICLDCLRPCSCQSREFALITHPAGEPGTYRIEVEYCYEELVLVPMGGSGSVNFSVDVG